MALLFIDGFEGYGAPADFLKFGTSNSVRYVSISSSLLTLSGANYRTTQPTAANSRSLSVQASGVSGSFVNLQIPSTTELIMGFGLRFNDPTTTNMGIIAIGGSVPYSASTGIVLAANVTAGTLSAHINSSGNPGTLLGTLSGTYSQGNWYYFEIRVKVGSTTGELQIKVDGSDVLNLTNINTATGSLTSYTGISIYLKSSPTGPDYWIDDMYLCDTTGSTNNTFLGPISVYSLMPNGAGSTTQLTPVGAATNWEAVDEGSLDTSTYVETSTDGNRDYYTFEDLPTGVSSVNGVMLKTCSTTSDGGGRKVKLNLKNGVSIISSTLRNLSLGSWFLESFLSETAPDGSAWSKTAVDSTEGGVEAG